MTWLVTLTRNVFDAPEISTDLFVYICDVTFENRACTSGASRHRDDTRELALEQRPNLHQQAIPSKNIPTCWSTDISQLCRTCNFLMKGQCASEIQLLNTPHNQLRCPHGNQMTSVWRSSILHAQSPAKTITRIFTTGGGGDSDTCHRDNVVTWQRRLRLLSIQT